jgi:hypothetical protein
MTKIYVDRQDINFLNQNKENKEINTFLIKFTKKYNKINMLIDTIEIFPKVVIHIIMEYYNPTYTVTCEYPENNVLYITSIIDNDTQTNLIKFTYSNLMINGLIIIEIYPSDSYSIHSFYNSFSTHEEKSIDIEMLTILDNVGFFNYFMEKYYNKQNYINDQNNDKYSSYSDRSIGVCLRNMDNKLGKVHLMRKITEYKKLKHLIIICKLLCKVLKNMNT